MAANQAGGSGIWVGITIMLLTAVMFAPATLLVFSAGMIPTVVAMVAFMGRESMRVYAMAAMNFSGVLIVLNELWSSSTNDFNAAMHALSDPFNWLIMLGMAAISLVLVWGGPIIASVGIAASNRAELSVIRARQKKAVEEWGGRIQSEANRMEASIAKGGRD